MSLSPAALPAQTGPEIRTVKVRQAYDGKDVELCYALWQPAGKPKDIVVGIHGLTRQKRDFDYIARYLTARGYAFYAVDAPGRGGSEWLPNPDDYRLDLFANMFAAFLKQMEMPRVHWIGTSMGGLLAMVMALKDQGGVFKSMTFNDITHKPNKAALHRIAGYMTENFPVLSSPEQYAVFLKQNLPLGDVPEEVWGHYAAHQLRKVDGGYTFHFDPKLVRPAITGLRADVDISEGLKKISCPVALVAGGVSDLCTQGEIADFRALKPDAKIYIVPKAGHVPALCDDASQQFIFEHIAKS